MIPRRQVGDRVRLKNKTKEEIKHICSNAGSFPAPNDARLDEYVAVVGKEGYVNRINPGADKTHPVSVYVVYSGALKIASKEDDYGLPFPSYLLEGP